MNENSVYKCLVNFLDFKDSNLKDLFCNVNFEHRPDKTNLELTFDMVDKKLYKSITDMLYERHNRNIDVMDIKLVLINKLGIIVNELNFKQVFDGFNYDFKDNIVKLKFSSVI